MEDIYYVILSKLSLGELLVLEPTCKIFSKIVQELLVIKIKMIAFIKYLKNNTIFPIVIKLKKINVFTGKYRNREEEPILLCR